MDLILEINGFGIHQYAISVFKMTIFGPIWALGPKTGGICKIKIWKSVLSNFFGTGGDNLLSVLVYLVKNVVNTTEQQNT